MAAHQLFSAKSPTPSTDRRRRIYNFLRGQYVGVLSTVTPDGDPHGAVVYYMVGDDFTIWLLTKKRTRKYDNLVHHDHAMLTVFEPRMQTTVQVLGTAAEYAALTAVNAVSNEIFIRMMLDNENQLPPIVKLQAGSFTTFAIRPVQIRMAVYSQPDAGDYSQLFESIESFEMSDK